MHGLEGLSDVFLQHLGINGGEGVIHPGLMPPDPVRGRDPQVFEGLKITHKFGQLVILLNNKRPHNISVKIS